MTVQLGPLSIRTQQTVERQAAPSGGSRFREFLDAGTASILRGVESVASVVPGGQIITAAVRGLGEQGSGAPTAGAQSADAPSTAGTPGVGGLGETLQSSADQNTQYLQLQMQMQAENQRFTTLSNVMKARHETAKNAINNIR